MIIQENILIISGPSGVGKTTLAKRLMELHPEIKEEVSCTTRQKRPGETDGVEYRFITRVEFLALQAAGGFFECSEYNGNLYGTTYSELEKKTNDGNLCVMLLDIPGTQQIKGLLPNACAVFLTAPISVLEQRLRRRGTDSEEVILQRLDSATTEIILGQGYEDVLYSDVITSDCLDDMVRSVYQVFKPLSHLTEISASSNCKSAQVSGMIRLTEYTGERWIARVERMPDGSIVGDKKVYARLAEYENLGLLPDEIRSLLHDGGIAIAIRNRELRAKLDELENKSTGDGTDIT